MTTTIDGADYAVLKCLQASNGSWKKQVHSWIQDNADNVPMMEKKSEQTIGRRIDDLHERGLIESCIVSSDSVNRDMIIGYKLTDDGQDALQEKRTAMLKEFVEQSMKHLLHDTGELDIDRDGLAALMCDEFGIDEETRERVLEPLTSRELVSVLNCHYMKQNANSNITRQHEPLIADLIQCTQISEPFFEDNASTRIQNTIKVDADHIQTAPTEDQEKEVQ